MRRGSNPNLLVEQGSCFRGVQKPLTRPPPVCTGRYRLPWGALSLGRELSFPVRVKVRKTALSLGERVARCRRFHQPERAG
jgi:hypothetical protein